MQRRGMFLPATERMSYDYRGASPVIFKAKFASMNTIAS